MMIIFLVIMAIGVLFLPWLWRVFYPLPYRDTIFAQAEAAGVDPYLVMAVIRVESKFRPKALSVRGAKGLMQLMPETARWAAGQMGEEYRPDLLFDVVYNTKIGCWYLASLIEEFDGNLPAALAAYNGGPNNVKQWLQEGKWNGELETVDDIPFQETRDFVRRVLKDHDTYRRIYGWYPNFAGKGGFWGTIPNRSFVKMHS
ncbi:MAG: lytic transglycosylase domain-containing protein [Clostridia bacterium]|nr:lytic transglycosylase domain-containing protein [Clostridia bacterium]